MPQSVCRKDRTNGLTVERRSESPVSLLLLKLAILNAVADMIFDDFAHQAVDGAARSGRLIRYRATNVAARIKRAPGQARS
jgi:hypothetical protein